MAHLLNRAIRVVTSPRPLILSQKRLRSKINIQKPQKLFYQRALVTEFVSPCIPVTSPPVPIWEKCKKTKKRVKPEESELHPYLRILATECLQRYRDSKMTAFFHKNSMTAEEQFDFAVAIHKHNMYMKIHGRSITNVAFKDTEFEPMLPLFCTPTVTVFSPEVDVENLRKAAKKFPQLVLIAGIMHGRLLSRNDFLKYGKMDLTEARSQLVHTLRTAGGANLNRQLNHHQSTLVSRLQQIASNEGATKNNESEAEDAKSEIANSEEAKPE